MPIRLAVPKEIFPGERRVALDPGVVERFTKLNVDVLMERGAGKGAHFPDDAYAQKAKLIEDSKSLYAEADVVLKVQPPTIEELDLIKEGAVIIGFMQPHRNIEMVKKLRDKKITSFAMELVPRISRAIHGRPVLPGLCCRL
jgi:NAD(P) transhydrogenase subunit alpha